MTEIMELIIKIIIIIITKGESAISAVSQVAKSSGVPFAVLWNLLDDKYK
ncbi:MAG: hypothetical protein N2Z71_00815 [Caloramator sp.]|nr:hypothetical protein [Caloramator sp.]